MIIEYTDCHVHRIRLDFSDLEVVPELLPVKSRADVMDNNFMLLEASLPLIRDVRHNGRSYSVLTYQNNTIWLNGYEK